MSADLQRAALAYARKGLFVFPCKPSAKTPITEHGLLDATTDTAQIERWWSQAPTANVAISCGPSGIVALDIDPRSGGDVSFEALRAELGAATFETKSQITPSGGTHFLFAAPPEPVANSAGALGPGLDIRGAGGYILVPPSVNGNGGYVWEHASRELPLAPFPAVLLERLRPKQGHFEPAPSVESGGRNAFLASMAGALRRKGLSPNEIHAALTTANRDRCDPPIPKTEVAAIARSIGRYAPADPIVTPGSAGRPGTGVLTFDDLARKCTEQIDWFVDGILRSAGILFITAQPKVGKSELARNLAKAVATGGHFLGRRCRKGKVLFIELEESPTFLADRLEAMQMQELDIVYAVERPAHNEGAWLRALVEEHRPTMVIVDTIARLVNVEKVEDYSQVTRATQPLLDIRAALGTTFAILHHNGKNDTTLGSTMWDGFYDTKLSITRSEDGSRFFSTRGRGLVEIEPTRLKMNDDTGEVTCAESKFIADRRVAERRILKYASLIGRPATREELARHSGRPVSVGRAAVDSLVIEGLLVKEGEGTKNSPRLYKQKTWQDSPERETSYIYVEESEESEVSANSAPRSVRGISEESEVSEESEESEAAISTETGCDTLDPTGGDLLGYARDLGL